MWICTTKGFYSIVLTPKVENADNKSTEIYTVRARVKSHLESDPAFSDKIIYEYRGSDYEYRVYCTWSEMENFFADNLSNINYKNFKNSISNSDLYTFFNDIWSLGRKHFSVWTNNIL